MNIYVATCDKYDHLLPGFAYLFNKYWGEVPVHIMGFRSPPPLPGNFIFHSMEPKETKPWTTNLNNFFTGIPDEYFVFLLDDYWLRKPVDHARVRVMEECVRAGADKGDLSANTHYFTHTVRPDGLVEACQDAQYRTSTQPCIWRRRYMLKLLEPGRNPWQFELSGLASRDGARIVGPTSQIYDYANVYYKGEPAHYMVETLSKEDRYTLKGMNSQVH